jgi:cystathionine gamma-synthase
VALAQDAYYGTGVLLGELERWGLEHVLFDQTGPPPARADLVWIEAPSNPLLTMPDFEAAAAHPGLVVCDATAATPVHLRPLELGCDLVLHSATKYLGGHHDVLLGAVVCKDAERAARLHEFRTRSGIVAAPDAAWLLGRGLKTLEVRVARQSETAAVLVERLGAHPDVQTVRYPGFGGLLSFDVTNGDSARRVETGTGLIVNATSLGGVTSTIESRHRWEGDRVPEGLLRLAVGLEPAEELWRDLAQALDRA